MPCSILPQKTFSKLLKYDNSKSKICRHWSFKKGEIHTHNTHSTTFYEVKLFDILSVRVEDYFFISSKRKGKTLIRYYHVLKAFYYFLLDELEEEVLDDPNDFRLFSKQKRNIEKFLKSVF